LSYFGIGPVYYYKDVPSSAYYKALPHDYPVEFNTNFLGMGAPEEVFKGVYNRMVRLEPALICNFTQGGFCYLKYGCEQYEKLFGDYVFNLNFTSNATYVMRIPLTAFIVDGTLSNGNGICVV
jgi:hypothetical protein